MRTLLILAPGRSETLDTPDEARIALRRAGEAGLVASLSYDGLTVRCAPVDRAAAPGLVESMLATERARVAELERQVQELQLARQYEAARADRAEARPHCRSRACATANISAVSTAASMDAPRSATAVCGAIASNTPTTGPVDTSTDRSHAMTRRRFLLEIALLSLALALLCTVFVRVAWSRESWLFVLVAGVSVAAILIGLVFGATAYMGWREEQREDERDSWRRR